MHKTGEVVTTQFCVSDPATGGLINADAPGPTGTLIVNGVADAATVTVANISTGVYSASVTLPTIADGDELQIRIAATVATVTGGGIVWSGVGCTKRPADVAADVASALATAHGAGSWLTATGFELAGAAAAALTAWGKTGFSLIATGLDLVQVAGQTLPEAVRRIGTITSGVVSGAGTGTETFTDWASSVHTIVISVDPSGNRTSITYN